MRASMRNEKFTFSCALVSLFWTLMASFPAVTPFPVSAMSCRFSPAVCRTSEEEEVGEKTEGVADGETLPWCVKPPAEATWLAARNSNPGDSFLKV